MPATLRQEHRATTQRRIVAAARKVFVKKGYTKATIEDIITAAGVSRTTLYVHFDSKYALLGAAAAKMSAESNEHARRLATVLVAGDRAALRAWMEWALEWYVRNRPMALAAQEAELTEDRPGEGLRDYLDRLEPWVQTWPAERRAEARMRFELCRVQIHHYMWGNSAAMFLEQGPPLEVLTELWWDALVLAR